MPARARPSPARRAPPRRGRSTWATCASSSPCTSSPTSCADAALPVRHLHVWDDYDRFRKVPAGVDPSLGRPHRAAAERASPTRGTATPRGPSTSRRRCATRCTSSGSTWRRCRRPSATRPASTASRSCVAVRHRDDIEAVLARHRTRQSDPARRPTWRPRRFPFKAYCRQCGRDTTTPSSYDEETTDLAYTCSSCGFAGVTNLDHAGRGQAGLEGRLADALGLRARRLRAGRDGPRDARVVVHGRPRAGRVGLRDAAAGVVRLRLRRLRRHPEDVVVRRRRSDRGRRAAGAGGADPAVALRPPQPEAGLRHRLRARGRPAVRRVGRPGPQGRLRQARRGRARPCAGVGDRDRRRAPDLSGDRAVPGAVVGGGRDRRIGLRRSAGVVSDVGLPARLGRRPRTAAVEGDAVDRGVRPGGRPHHGPRPHRTPPP